MRIAVIASMKRGLEHFVYRELLVFAAQGLTITLFPTKYQQGLYGPPPDWRVHRWHPLVVCLLQPYCFVRAPLRYLRLLGDALMARALVDFALAWYMAHHMADADAIYATFGDRKLFIGYFCKRITGKPLFVTIHAYELYLNPNTRLFTRALDACDRIVTVTDYNKERLVEDFRISPSRVDVVRISVDLDDYRPTTKFVVLIVAFFAERKGHEVLFRAIKQLGYEDVEVWVVGDEGPEQAVDVRRLGDELGVGSQVAFFGKLGGNALKAVFRACDVFCLPCHQDSHGVSEGFPTVLAEAMAFGKPVITTRHVEIPRIVEEIVVDERDVNGLAKALRQVYESPSLRRRLGNRNLALAQEHFSSGNAEHKAALFRAVARPSQRRTVVASAFRRTPGPAEAGHHGNEI